MKILTILLILLQINTFNYGNHSSTNGNNRYSGDNVPVEQTYRGIGYSTNCANGQFNSEVYKSSMTTLGYHTGTYNPTVSGSGGSRPGGGPRRVKGYDGNGNEIGGEGNSSGPEQGTGIGWGELFWEDEDEYEYYYNSKENRWYRKDSEGNVSEWDNFLGWHWSILYGHTIPSGSAKGYHENPVPIGDAIVPLLSLLLLYIGYDVFKRENS